MPDRPWDNRVTLGDLVTRFAGVAEDVVDYGVDLVSRAALRDIPRDTGETARSETHGREGTRGQIVYHSRKAKALHENLTDHHRNGRAKFLESNLTGSAAAIRRRAVEEFRAAMEGHR